MSRAEQEVPQPTRARFGIDARALRSGPAGIATYVKNLIQHIPELRPVRQGWPRNNFVWNQLVPPTAALFGSWDLYHSPCYTGPLWLPTPLVVTAPDVCYLVNPEWYPYALSKARLTYYRASLRRADRIIVTSEFSRNELARVLPEVKSRIRCTYLAASSEFSRCEKKAVAVRRTYQLPEQFLLHVGDIHRRRNIPLLQAVSKRLGIPLVLVGRVLDRDHIDELSRWHFQDLTLTELVGFYSAASVLTYASHYEGFGLPLLEAFACDLPVVAAATSSIPEVCGNAAVQVELDVEAFAVGVKTALNQRSELVTRGRARRQKFSWQLTAKATREIYQELLAG